MAFVDAQLAGFATGVRETRLQIDLRQPDPADLLFGQRQGPDGPGGTDLSAGVATRLAAGPVGHDMRRPDSFESLLKSDRVQHVIRTRLVALAAANAHLQEFLLGDAARRPDGTPRIGIVEIGTPDLHGTGHPQPAGNARSQSDSRRQEAAASQWRFIRRRIVENF